MLLRSITVSSEARQNRATGSILPFTQPIRLLLIRVHPHACFRARQAGGGFIRKC